MPLFENFPYTNFHDLNLDWILKIVKQFSDTMAGLDDKIAEIVKEQLDELNLEQIILETVTKYGLSINVVAPPNNLQPADPTGAEESTMTIQGCIDYANAQGGGVVFFPAGRYLTGSLTLKSNVALVGFDMYTSRLTLKGGANAPLLSGDVQNCFIGGLTFDGNSEVQVDDLTNVALTCNNVGFDNVRFTGGYILAAITGSGGDVWANGLTFGTCVQNALVAMGTGNFRFTGMKFNDLSAVGGVNVIGINTDNGIYDFQSVATCTVCCDISGDGNIVHCRVENAGTAVQDNGEGNQIVSYGDMVKAVYENFSLTVSGDVNIGSETANLNLEGKSVNVSGTDFKMEQSEPTTYKTPAQLNKFFNSVPFKDPDGTRYNVLVESDGTENIGGLSGYINVADYGAVGDGVTNDTEAIRNAINAGNTTGKTVIFEKGKKYLINGNAEINVKCNVNFNWAVLLATDVSGNLFIITADNATTINTTNSVFTQERTTDSRLFNKVFNLVTPISLGVRTGSDTEFFINVMIVTDGNGYFTNVKLPFNIVEGDYIAENVHEIGNNITIENAVLDFSNIVNSGISFFRCERSNVKFSGFQSLGENVSTESRFIMLSRCAFNEIENIHCATPFTASGYVIGVFIASDLYVHDCTMRDLNENSWGSIGVSFLTNFYYERVKSNRFDCHYYASGFYVVKESECNYFTIPGGFGNIIVENTLLNAKTYAGPLIDQRADLQNFYNGKIIFDNCILKGANDYQILRYWTRYEIANLAEMNPDKTIVKFNNCKFYGEYQQPFVFNNINQTVADLIVFIVENSIFITNTTGIIAIRYDSNFLNNVVYKNFKIKGFLSLNKMPSYAEFNSCEMDISTFASGEGALILKNNKMGGKNYAGNYSTIIYIGNILLNDRAMTDTATNKCLSDNIIISETKENLSSWNSGVE